MKTKLSAALTALLLCLLAVLPAQADTAQAHYARTAAHLQTLTPQVGSVGGEWLVLGLCRADLLTQAQQDAYLQNAEAYVKAVGAAKLHRSKSSDNARMVLALSALGKDARNFAGFDITSPLFDVNYVQKQGINGVIWALIALDCCRYPSPEGVREDLLSLLLQAQHSDGGWGLDENISDPDVTAMALTALAPYRFFDSDVLSSVDKGLLLLASLQQESGGYASYDSFNPESCAQVITALCALDIHPLSDNRFCRGGRSLVDSLMRFAVTDGFCHTLGGSYNQMATEQAFYSLTALNRLQNRQTALYHMTDVQSFAVQSIDEVTALQRYVAEFPQELTVPQQMCMDADGNGKLTVNDVTALQRLLCA